MPTTPTVSVGQSCLTRGKVELYGAYFRLVGTNDNVLKVAHTSKMRATFSFLECSCTPKLNNVNDNKLYSYYELRHIFKNSTV